MCEHIASFAETILPVAGNWDKLESAKEREKSVNAVFRPAESKVGLMALPLLATFSSH
jgi:hypothetical protein